MAFSVVQSAPGVSSSTATVSTSLGSTPTNGNAIVVHVSWTTATGQIRRVYDNQATNQNAYLQMGVQEQAQAVTTALFICFNYKGSGALTVSADLDAGHTSTFVSVFEVSGLAGYPPTDGSPIGSNNTTTGTVTVGTITTSQPSSVILVGARDGTVTAGTGFTLVAGTLLSYQVVSPGANTVTVGATTAWSATAVAIPLGVNTGFNPWIVSGDVGGAIEFVDTWSLNFGNVLDYERTQAWTVACAIKLLNASTNTGALMFSNVPIAGSAFPGYEFWVDTSGKLRVRIINNITTGPNYIGLIGTSNLIDSTWHIVAATYDGSSTAAGVKIYKDGVAETLSVESDTLSASIIGAGQNLIVGNQQGREALFNLNGYLDEFSISNIVRAGTFSSLPPNDSNTQMYLSFNEGTGNVVHDTSQNSFSAIIPGAFPASLARYKFPLGPYAYV